MLFRSTRLLSVRKSAHIQILQGLRCCFTSAAQVQIEADKVESADSHNGVNDSGKPGHISKYKGHQVKAENTNQQPVDCTNNYNGESSTVQIFISHSYLTFCAAVESRLYYYLQIFAFYAFVCKNNIFQKYCIPNYILQIFLFLLFRNCSM